MSGKAILIVRKVENIKNKTILYVDSISDGIVKLYGVYNLSYKFNIKINQFIPYSAKIFTHPIINLALQIQLIDDYKQIEVGDILYPLL
jgi:hypothetical protein